MKKIFVIFLLAIFSITSVWAQSNKKWTDVELSKYGIGKEKGNDGKNHLVYDKVETLEIGKIYKWLNTSGKSEPQLDKNSGSYSFGLYEVVNGKQNSYPSATLWISSNDAKKLYGQTKKWNGFEELGFKQTWSNQTWGWGTRDENVGEWVSIRLFSYGLVKIYTDAEYAKFGIGKEKGNDGNEYLVYDKVEKLEKGKTYKWLNTSGGTEPMTDSNDKSRYGFGLYEVVKGKTNSYPSAVLWVTTNNAQKLYGQTKKWNGFEDLGLREDSSWQNWGWGLRDENTGEWVSHRYFSYRLNKVVSDKELVKNGIIKRYWMGSLFYVYDKPKIELEVGKIYRWLNTKGGVEPEKNDHYYLFRLVEVENGKLKNPVSTVIGIRPMRTDEDIGFYGKDIVWNGFDELINYKLTPANGSNREVVVNQRVDEKIGIDVGEACIQHEFIYNNMKSLADIIINYSGYETIVKKGFDIKSLDNVKTAQELHAALKPYVVDQHFNIEGTDGFRLGKQIVFLDEYAKKVDEKDILTNENYLKNPDKEDWYAWYPLKNSYRKVTLKVQQGNSNHQKITKDYYTQVYKDLVYIYIASMMEPFVVEKFTSMLDDCKNKKYIVIDTRNNPGGFSGEYTSFFNELEAMNFKGKIYIIVNNQNGSAAEMILVDSKRRKEKLDSEIVGENTSGTLNFGGPIRIEYNGIFLRMPTSDNQTGYEEGVGIFPDIFSTEDDLLETMKMLTGVTLPFDKL